MAEKNGSRNNVRNANNVRTAAALGGVFVAMVGLSFAAVPLYETFCRVTGYGGTTATADAAPEAAAERTITVRFNGDINPNLPWTFEPLQRTMEVQVGEVGLAHYGAENTAATANVGTATYNVTPEKAGPYFSKIECFCFTEQHLAAGQSVEMPVTFFIDPAIMDDPNMNDVDTITLSYTFFPKPGVEPEPRETQTSSAGTVNGNGGVN